MSVPGPIPIITTVTILAVSVFTACGGDRPAPIDLDSETFVQVMVELREAEREVMETDSAAAEYARRKADILDRHETSEEEIREFVRFASRELPRLNAIWDTIAQRLRYAQPSDDTLSTDTLAADTLAVDTLAADTLATDTVLADTLPGDAPALDRRSNDRTIRR